MVAMRKDMTTVEKREIDAEQASTGELITRLTRETVALVKAEVARYKLKASSVTGSVISAGALAAVGLGTFALGLFGFGVALFFGILAVSGSEVLAGIVVGAVAFVLAGIAGAVCAAVVRAIPHRLEKEG